MKTIKNILRQFISVVFSIITCFCLFFVWSVQKKKLKNRKQPRLFFGCSPLINNKYWAAALKEAGFFTETIVTEIYSINQASDFDWCFSDFKLFKIKFLDSILSPYLVFLYILRNFDVVHLAFDGGALYSTPLKWLEAYIYKIWGIKIVVLSYGGDFQRYSETTDLCWRHALMINYPQLGKIEKKISKWVDYYNFHADCVVLGQMVDGASRWDILPVNFLSIDELKWRCKLTYSQNDGKNGFVKIIHTPNHRGVKGTEFICKAIRELEDEGLLIDFILLEKVPNEKVKQLMQEADILVEQLIFPGYALSAIEGMASGLPVISNLTNPIYRPLFSRYSYLNDCPIYPSDVENIKDRLRTLIREPLLRKELGLKGRKYIEKYNSRLTAQLMFGRIYEKIWYEKKIDLINYFHPLIGQFDQDYKNAMNIQHYSESENV